MSWIIFAIATFIVLVLQTGLGPLLEIGRDPWQVTPNLLLILAVFAGMQATARQALAFFLILGLLTDLLHEVPVVHETGQVSAVALLGPATLGFLVAGYALLQLRTMVYRQSLPALVGLVLACGTVIHLVTVAVLTLRGLPWPLGEPIYNWQPSDELARRFFQLLYTAVAAWPVGWLLGRTRSWWGFESGK